MLKLFSRAILPWFSGYWHHGVVVITTAQPRSTKSELGFCTGSNPACGVSEVHDGENL